METYGRFWALGLIGDAAELGALAAFLAMIAMVARLLGA
jgi:hypothetical protein